jgi:V/A-type H+-transporting ATPase subunit K
MLKDDKRLFLILLTIGICILAVIIPYSCLYALEAAAKDPPAGAGGRNLLAIAAMGAVSVSCMSSAYALARIGSAALGAMSEKPEIGGRALIFLGMAEGIAIYGLIVAIMMINRM